MKLDGYVFTPAAGGDGVAEDAFARYVVMNRHIGFGRMIQMIAAIWDQTPDVHGMGRHHAREALKTRGRKRR